MGVTDKHGDDIFGRGRGSKQKRREYFAALGILVPPDASAQDETSVTATATKEPDAK